jgi:hypothetical protein
MMTRDGFALLAMGFTGKKALAWKIKYLQAYNAMEREMLRKLEGTSTDGRREMLSASGDEKPVMTVRKIKSSNKTYWGDCQKVIQGLLAYWAFMDAIPIKKTETYLCSHLGIHSISEMTDESFSDAYCFCLDNAARLNQKSGGLSHEQMELVDAMFSACDHTNTCLAESMENLFKRLLAIDSFQTIGPEDMPKVAACFWSIINRLGQYNQLCRQVQ